VNRNVAPRRSATADGDLPCPRLVAITSGGPPQTICQIEFEPRGGTWQRTGVILIGSNHSLMRVSDAGGSVAALSDTSHPFVQDADDLDHAVPRDAIVENVNRPSDLSSSSRTSCVPDMEASYIRTEFRSLPCEWPFGLSRNLAHRSHENACVPLPALDAPPLGVRRKDVGQIYLCGARETKPRHSSSARALERASSVVRGSVRDPHHRPR
jgi:hypothetical protein